MPSFEAQRDKPVKDQWRVFKVDGGITFFTAEQNQNRAGVAYASLAQKQGSDQAAGCTDLLDVHRCCPVSIICTRLWLEIFLLSW